MYSYDHYRNGHDRFYPYYRPYRHLCGYDRYWWDCYDPYYRRWYEYDYYDHWY